MRLEVEKSGLVASSLGCREARRRSLLPSDLEEEDSLETFRAAVVANLSLGLS